MAEKKKKIRLVTPTGTARYAWLSNPDPKFPTAQGARNYKVDLVFNSLAELSAIAPIIEAAIDERFQEEMANKPAAIASKWSKTQWYHEEEDDQGNLTGRVFLRFKQAEFIIYKDEKIPVKPVGFDSGKPPKELPKGTIVFSGSQIKISTEVVTYASPKDKVVGASFRLLAYQVIELAQGSGGSGASAYGFSGSDDGFSAEDTSPSFPEEYDDAPNDEF